MPTSISSNTLLRNSKLPFGIKPIRLLQILTVFCLLVILFRSASKMSDLNEHSDQNNDGKNKKKRKSSSSKNIIPTYKPKLEVPNTVVENQHEQHQHVPASDSEFQKQTQNLQKFILFSQLRRAGAHFQLQRGGKSRACFISLVRHTHNGIERFVRLLKNVRENLPLMAARYPFVAFLEDSANIEQTTELINTLAGFTSENKKKSGGLLPLEHVFPAGILLVKVPITDFGQLPPFVRPESEKRWHYGTQNYWGLSYRYMCRFFGVRVMMQEILLKDFDFFLRLDTDSHILERPKTTVLVPSDEGNQNDENRSNKWNFLPSEFMTRARSWIEATHKSHLEEAISEKKGNKKEDENHDDEKRNNNNNKILSKLGFEEKVVDIDMFLDMAASDSKYSFSMLHPQTLPQFLYGLWESYDDFFKQEMQKESEQPPELRMLRLKCQQKGPGNKNNVVEQHQDGEEDVSSSSSIKSRILQASKKLSKRFGNSPILGGPEPFCSPRGTGLHFWDNFEITSVEMFQQIASSPDAVYDETDLMMKKKRGVTFIEEDFDEQKTLDRLTKRKFVSVDEKTANAIVSLPPSLTKIRNQVLNAFASLQNKKLEAHDENSSNEKENTDSHQKNTINKNVPSEKKIIQKHNSRALGLNRFLTHIDHSGGFFYNRWGDAEVRTLTVTLFLQSTEITYANNLPYQHYHNYHCPLAASQLPFARERGEVIPSSQMNSDAGDGGGGGDANDFELHLTEDQVKERIAQMIDYVQTVAGFDLSSSSSNNFDTDLVNQILHPSSSTSKSYYSAKALAAISHFVSSTRRSLFASISGNCEHNAVRPGRDKSGLATKGRGSARMMPAEHEQNNKYFWNYAKDQKDGFLSI